MREYLLNLHQTLTTLFQGEGYDFIELREYMSGDDIRHIDWNITAKMQKPFIKIFREERVKLKFHIQIINSSETENNISNL